ncbi:MAG: GntR family transcriptional regulator, partial [Planctomycetota bacterium]|nr:GntR family transcriptional regulator [Planctomycetota bacterium]
MANSSITKSRSKRQQVHESLQVMILGGQYPPGARLIQQDLATQLNSSVSVVREALVELVAVGLVDSVDHAGFFVGKLNIDKHTDTYRVRAIHQGLAARLCCERAGRKDVRELKEIAQRLHVLYQTDHSENLKEAILLDRQMHAQLIEIADSEVLTHASRSVWVPIVAVNGEFREVRHEDTHREHMAVIRAIEENRPDDADRLMQEHILNALKAMRKQMETGKAELRWCV